MTTPTPPRLTGNVPQDMLAMQEWMMDLYKALVINQDITALDLVAVAPLLYTAANRQVEIDLSGASSGQFLKFDGSAAVWDSVPAGTVEGPLSSTDNSLVRFNGTNGKIIQGSGIGIDDSDNMTGIGAVTIGGAINHTGNEIGFFGATATTQAAAYTQSYATADRTLAAYTADDESGAYTGIATGVGGTPYASITDLNALRAAYENLRAFVEDAVQMLNAVVDDGQSYGLYQ